MFNDYQKNPTKIYAVGLCNFIKKKKKGLNRISSNRKKSHEVMKLQAECLLARMNFFKERKKEKGKTTLG